MFRWPWKKTSISGTISSPVTPDQRRAFDAAFQKMDEAFAEPDRALEQKDTNHE